MTSYAKQQKFTDPQTEQMCRLLGGISFEAVTLSRNQIENLMKLYGCHHEKEKDWPPSTIEVPENPHAYTPYGSKPKMVQKVLGSAAPLAESAMLVSLGRRAKHDGLRMLAVLSRFCEPGQDPVKLLVQLCIEAGYDIGTLSEWAYEEDD